MGKVMNYYQSGVCVSLVTRAVLPALLIATILAGCGDSTTPNEEVAGAYAATTFIYTSTGQAPQDVLAAGGSLAITLGEDASTTGTLLVPDAITGSGNLIESMEGIFVRSGATLTFDQPADTFVRNVTWAIGNGTLTGTYANADGSVQVVLSRE